MCLSACPEMREHESIKMLMQALGVQGDCILVPSGSKTNFCVKAQRRTVFTNLDRVFTMQFRVSLRI